MIMMNMTEPYSYVMFGTSAPAMSLSCSWNATNWLSHSFIGGICTQTLPEADRIQIHLQRQSLASHTLELLAGLTQI